MDADVNFIAAKLQERPRAHEGPARDVRHARGGAGLLARHRARLAATVRHRHAARAREALNRHTLAVRGGAENRPRGLHNRWADVIRVGHARRWRTAPAIAGPAGRRPRFALERFAWGAPDRLELAGTFFGSRMRRGGARPDGAGSGGDIPAARRPERRGPPADGAPWAASFAWLEAPVAFDRARLELGPAFAVELPGPGRDRCGPSLPVSSGTTGQRRSSARRPPTPREPPAGCAWRRNCSTPSSSSKRTRVAARRAQDELDRAHADLAASAGARGRDAGALPEGLATVRASAEEALDAAALARSQADEEARTEIAALRERVPRSSPLPPRWNALRSELGARPKRSRRSRAAARSSCSTGLARPRTSGRRAVRTYAPGPVSAGVRA